MNCAEPCIIVFFFGYLIPLGPTCTLLPVCWYLWTFGKNHSGEENDVTRSSLLSFRVENRRENGLEDRKENKVTLMDYS